MNHSADGWLRDFSFSGSDDNLVYGAGGDMTNPACYVRLIRGINMIANSNVSLGSCDDVKIFRNGDRIIAVATNTSNNSMMGNFTYKRAYFISIVSN